MNIWVLAILAGCATAESQDFDRPDGPMGVTDGAGVGEQDEDTGEPGDTGDTGDAD